MTTETGIARVVVLGGGYAGALAAAGLARRSRGGGQVLLVTESAEFRERLRLHQVAADQPVRRFAVDRLLSGTGVELLVGTVRSLDLARRTVRVETGDIGDTGDTAGTDREIGYDTLVYALGSEPDVETVPGVAAHAGSLHDAAGAEAIAAQLRGLAESGGGTVAVCGGGFTGIELATELAESFPTLRVRLLTRGRLGAELPERSGRYLRSVLDRLGVDLRENADVVELAEGKAVLADGTVAGFDTCVWTGSVRVSPIAAAAGLAVTANRRIAVDATLRSVSHPDVYAVGDAAAVRAAWGGPIRMACQAAGPMGAYVARTIARRAAGRTVPAFRFGFLHQPLSLGRRRGLIQFVRADDSPRRIRLTGWVAAAYKEIVTTGGVSVVALVRRAPTLLRWYRGGHRTRSVAARLR